MRNLVIDRLMTLITEGVEIYGSKVEPITNRKELEALSNRDLLSMLIDAYAFQD
jgi:hypothetical protein